VASYEDDHYYLRTKQLPVWYSDDGSVQHESSFRVDESFYGREASDLISPFVPLEHIGCYGSERTCLFWNGSYLKCARGSKLQ
jgi:hypothetical protein